MFSIGRHFTQGKKFLGSMNMPPPPHKSSWYQHKKMIAKATETVATASKSRAAEEIKQKKGQDITVSCDGSWQRRRFQSKNGVVTALTVNGNQSNVIDTHVMSNHCDSCAKQKKKKTVAEFQEWYKGHEPNWFHWGHGASWDSGYLSLFGGTIQAALLRIFR